MYDCDVCKKKCVAIKGIKLEKLPYLLTLQLKRFDFDYECVCFPLLKFLILIAFYIAFLRRTMQRVKLNDEVRVPFLLDMNKYLEKGRQRRAVSMEKSQLFDSNEGT